MPALVISPFIPRNTIDHRVYDHASIPATVESAFGLRPLTARDASAQNMLSLMSLDAPRPCPSVLPEPVATVASLLPSLAAGVRVAPIPAARPDGTINDGSLPAIVHSAMHAEIERDPARRPEILARVGTLRTRQDAQTYLREIRDRG